MMDPQLLERLNAGFRQCFGTAPDACYFSPGRVNLIGEHTDYNDGFVLPAAISFGTALAIRYRDDDQVTVNALDYDDAPFVFLLSQRFVAYAAPVWANHVGGIAAALKDKGVIVRGADIAVTGNVPQGAGLSSSASLGVVLAGALARGAMTAEQLAITAQHSENQYVGTRCGIMDQLVSARGVAGHAVLIDCRSLVVTPVPMDDRLGILIVHSGVQRGLVDSAYNERRAQCEIAARHYGVAALRDLSLEQLMADRAGLDPVTFARARHVVTENARTLAMVDALAKADIKNIAALMAASHQSLRDDFAVSTPKVDALVDIIAQALTPMGGGVRMTGGGFGGCVVALGHHDALDIATAAARAHYRNPQGHPPQCFRVAPAAGFGQIRFLP
jgi:galactokinase